MTYRVVMDLIREDDLAYDPWGTAMSWHFAIADAMTEWAPPYPPAKWEYRQGMGGPDRDDYRYQILTDMLETGGIDAGDLLRIGNILQRYERVCERAGRAY